MPSLPTLFSLGFAIFSCVRAQMIHDVTVGGPNGETVYNPTSIVAQPGDQVMFHFNPKNHTVTQSTFAQPCTKAENGFDSSFNPVAVGTTVGNPTFSITVNTTAPIWVYCRQGENTAASHCGKGMVFSINPGADGSSNSFANFQAEALAVGAALAGSSVAVSSTALSSASTTYTAAYGTATIPPPPVPVTVTQTITVEASTWTTTYASYPDSPAPTPASLEGAVHKVIVGGSSLVFDPPTVSALPRDTIMFEFQVKNHTATQAAFDAPCVPLEGGFDAGFNPVAANATAFPTFNVTVNDTAPIWVFCRQTGHCGQGMVFAVNSVESSARNFEAFKALAIQLNGTSNATSTSTSSSSSSTSTSSVNSGASSLHVHGTIALAVAGLVLQVMLL